MLRKTIHVEEELFIDDHTMHLVDQGKNSHVAGRNIIAKKAWVVQRFDPSRGYPKLNPIHAIISAHAIMNRIFEKGCCGDSIIEGNTSPVSTMDAEQAADRAENPMNTTSATSIFYY